MTPAQLDALARGRRTAARNRPARAAQRVRDARGRCRRYTAWVKAESVAYARYNAGEAPKATWLAQLAAMPEVPSDHDYRLTRDGC